MNYVDLPIEVKQFQIIPDNLEELIPNNGSHYWNTYDLSMFFTTDGLKYFKDKGFNLYPHGLLFRAPANTDTIIHTDVPLHFAMNFVLKGSGEMQWVEAEGEIENRIFVTESKQTYQFDRYKSVTKVDVIDRWAGDMAIVRTDMYHRVHTNEVDRICLSVRANTFSFEKAVSLFGV